MTQNRTRISVSLTPAEFCDVTNACKEGRNFALKYATMAEVWDNCLRIDWLMWIANAINQRPDDRTLRLFAVWCARNTPLADGRKTGELLTDPRSVAVLDVAERYAEGFATGKELAAARDAARDAAWDAARAAAYNAQSAHFRTLVHNPFQPKQSTCSKKH